MKERSTLQILEEVKELSPKELEAVVCVLSRNTTDIDPNWEWALRNLSGEWDHYHYSQWISPDLILISKIRKRMRVGLGLTGKEIDRE